MTHPVDELRERMEAAAAALDFEEARRLRDRINLIRGGATAEAAAETDTSDIARQRSGAMGLGSSQPGVIPPPGWVRPVRPDPMTTGRARRR